MRATGAAEADFRIYSDLGGNDLQLPGAGRERNAEAREHSDPGPIRSFARMAALSGDIQPDDILPALARNVVTNGYQASHANDELEETEYLKLVHRYLSQARELDKLAGADKVIRVDDLRVHADQRPAAHARLPDARRLRQRSGARNGERARAPSSRPIRDFRWPNWKQALRTDKPFSYDYHPASATILYTPDYWLSAQGEDTGRFHRRLSGRPRAVPLLSGHVEAGSGNGGGVSRTASRRCRLRAFASVLDFFGGNFEIRQGKAVVPGGAKSAGAWADLAGASPDKGASSSRS